MLLLIPKGKTYIFYLYDVLKTILDLEYVKIVCTDNVCKMKTID